MKKVIAAVVCLLVLGAPSGYVAPFLDLKALDLTLSEIDTKVNRKVNEEIAYKLVDAKDFPWSDLAHATDKAVFDAAFAKWKARGLPGDPEQLDSALIKELRRYPYYTVEERGTGNGDCKTYASTKRARLRALGVPESALAIWSVYVPKTKAYHAVLQMSVVEKGQMRRLILDSRSDAILPREELEGGEYLFLEKAAVL